MEDGVFVYGCPSGPPTLPAVSSTFFTLEPSYVLCTLTDDDKALLRSVESKLTELLKRTAPEADAVKEIKRRVADAISGIGHDGYM